MASSVPWPVCYFQTNLNFVYKSMNNLRFSLKKWPKYVHRIGAPTKVPVEVFSAYLQNACKELVLFYLVSCD